MTKSQEILAKKVMEKRGTKRCRSCGSKTIAKIDVRIAATQIGISSASLTRIEQGKPIGMAMFIKVCHWLEIDPGKILRKEKNAKEKG